MQIEVRPDEYSAAVACAEWIAEHLARAASDRGMATMAFSGGRTPARMLEELAKAGLDWNLLHVFQVDERAVREDHSDRNLRLLREHLLAGVELPAGNLHPMPVGMANLDDAARRYEHVLREVCGRPARLDVVHLGLGDDGHTASLVPGDPVVEEEGDDVAAVGRYGGHRRLTLTAPTLRRSRHQAWLVTGASKSGALRDLESGRGIAAQATNEDAVAFADDAAAGVAPAE